jgi:hypothetical protein
MPLVSKMAIPDPKIWCYAVSEKECVAVVQRVVRTQFNKKRPVEYLFTSCRYKKFEQKECICKHKSPISALRQAMRRIFAVCLSPSRKMPHFVQPYIRLDILVMYPFMFFIY